MNRWYYAKKWFSLFPGFLRPVSAPFLGPYYQVRRAERSWLGIMLDGLVCVGFMLWVPFRARSISRKLGLGAQWARQASVIGRRRFVDPQDIALFRMTSDLDGDRFMRRFEYAEISKRINPAAWKADCVLADKVRFAGRARSHGLPIPPLLARILDGHITIFELPATAFVALKPTRGMGGSGFALLEVPPAILTPGDFESFLRSSIGRRRGDWIIQPKIPVHTVISDISPRALPTARITTMQDEKGTPEIVTAVLRLPGRHDAIVDNLAAGGLLAPIDRVSGIIGMACYGRRPGDLITHPATGARIEGRVLPNWSETMRVVARAHQHAFSEYVMVGWDVAIAAQGPVLIEGNGKPGLFASQRAERVGVGETRFGELLTFHLARSVQRPRALGKSTATE